MQTFCVYLKKTSPFILEILEFIRISWTCHRYIRGRLVLFVYIVYIVGVIKNYCHYRFL